MKLIYFWAFAMNILKIKSVIFLLKSVQNEPKTNITEYILFYEILELNFTFPQMHGIYINLVKLIEEQKDKKSNTNRFIGN